MVNEVAFYSAFFAIITCAGISLSTECAAAGREGVAFLVACLATLCGFLGIVACVFSPMIGWLV